MASRQARHNRRQRRGLVVYDVVADEVCCVEWLIDMGLLRPEDVDDRKAAARAIAEVLWLLYQVDA